MAGTPTPIYPQVLKNWAARIAPADTTTLKTLVAGGTNGSKVESIVITSTDTSARDVKLYMTMTPPGGSSMDVLIGIVSIPANSGNSNALPTINLLGPTSTGQQLVTSPLQIPGLAVDAFGNKYIYVANGSTLKIAAGVTVTAAKQIDAFAQGGDY